MKQTSSITSPRRFALATASFSALIVLAAPGAEAQLTPQVPRSIGQPTPAPGSLKSGQADLVPFLDESTLVRDIKNAQVRVSPDGRTEQKIVTSSSLCAGLAPGASRQVTLPDITWGVKNEVPRTVAGGAIEVATVDRPFRIMLGGGIPQVLETVNRIAPGETKVFRAPRREPKTIQVTQFQVPARVRPTPVPPPSGVNAVRVGNPQPSLDDAASLRCVSNVFVRDPNGHVAVDFEGAIAETNETNNRKEF
jgi:hypothetical protein